MRITLDALETLEAIQETGSFAGAAQRLHKVQSAVSYTIRQLEESLGVELFDRSGHRARLTEVGRLLLDEGQLLLTRARRLEALAERLRDRWEPRLEVVIDGVLPIEPILQVLKRMVDEAVPTRIQVKVEFLGGVQDRFEKDRADLMLVKDYTPSSALIAHRLPEVEVVLVASAEHPLARAGAPLELADLHRHVELTVHDPSESRRLSNPHQLGSERVFYLSDFLTKKAAIELGLGFGWMPLYLVEKELAAGNLREVAYRAGSRFRFAPALVHPADRPLGRAGQRFREVLAAAGLPHTPESPRPPEPSPGKRRPAREGRQRR
jgi:DNA-binding transcriptional LysR family regulator